MGKYKFELVENAVAAQNEILQNNWGSVSEQNDVYINLKTNNLTPDLIIDIEKIIKKHGGKAKFVFSLG